jgi:hypothetical protein
MDAKRHFQHYFLQSVLLVEETSIPLENKQSPVSHYGKLYHISVLWSTPSHRWESNTQLHSNANLKITKETKA